MTTVCRRISRTGSAELSDASPVRSPNAGGAESDYDSARSESDLSETAENGESQRKIDHDEDRSNPQYIPKRGTFYEHDDRTAASVEEVGGGGETPTAGEGRGEETPVDRRGRPRKSNTQDKWQHDKFNENQQTPKSREELIATYGYDIRNEEAPPHARRNRKYGRGPTKYTRTWEDEDAYRRQQAAVRKPQTPPTPQDFPHIDETRRISNKPRDRPATVRSPRPAPAENGSPPAPASAPAPAAPRPADRRNGAPGKPPTKDKDKVPMINLTITATNNNNNGSLPQRKVNASVHAQQKPVSNKTESPQSKPVTEKQSPPEKDRHISTQSPKPTAAQPVNAAAVIKQNTPQSVQPATAQQPTPLGESRPGSKRYSSLRQRPLTETYSPAATPPIPAQTLPQSLPQTQPLPQSQQLPQTGQTLPQGQSLPQTQALAQQQMRYVPEFQPSGQAQLQGSPGTQMHQPQQLMHQVHRTAQVSQPPHGPSPPHQSLPQQQQHPQQVRIGILEQQQLVSHQHALHNIPAPHTMAAQMPPAQGYAPQAMIQAQYMQGANTPVYSAAPVYAAPPPAPYPHQLYQHHNYTHVTSQQGSGGGVTYYSPVEQEQTAPAPRTQRRPTAAIPIVPPPPHVKTGSSSEKDSIDRIVDNMFIRKQRPAAHAPAPDKADSSPCNSLTSSSISSDSRPSAERQDSKDLSMEALIISDPAPDERTSVEQPVELSEVESVEAPSEQESPKDQETPKAVEPTEADCTAETVTTQA